jgi:hypothetical protein
MPKISELTAITSLSADDLIMVVNDPNGAPSSNKITVGNLFGNVRVSATFANAATFSANVTVTNFMINNKATPTSNTDNAQAGKVWYDNDYIYVAVANNSIKRVALSNF